MKLRAKIAGMALVAASCFGAQPMRAQNELPPPPQQDYVPPPAPTVAPSQSAPVPVPVATEAPAQAQQSGDPQLKQNPLDALRSFEPSADEEYRLGRGDEIAVDFMGRPELAAKLTIGPDGRITLPLADELMVAGHTRQEAAHAIQTALSAYYQNLAVQVTVTKYTSNRVLVLGAVTTPGEINFDGTPTLLAALTRAGLSTGPDKISRIPEECAIYRGNEQVVWVQLKQLIESGNTLADLRLRRGDVIYVPNMSERVVSMLGEVQHPGAVPLTNNSTLASLLAAAGGLAESAGNNPHIQIVDPATGTSRVFRLHDVLNPVKTTEISLRPGDIVFVPRSGFYKATYVFQRLSPIFQLSTLAYLGAVL